MNSNSLFFSFKRSCLRIGMRACALVVVSGVSFSADVLSLSQAQAQAATANPRLLALRHQHDAAFQRIALSTALPDPKVQAAYFVESVETRTGPQEAAYSVSQSVPWLGKLRERKHYATSEEAAVGLTYRNAVLGVRRDVALIYYEASYLGKAIESTEANLQLIAELQDVIEERVRGGASLNSLLRLNVEEERNQDQLFSLQQKLVTRRAGLAALLAVDFSQLQDLSPLLVSSESIFEAADLRSLELAMESNNPELLSLRKGVESSEYQEALARLDRYPDFTFGVNYIDVGSALDSSTPDAGKDPWSVSVAVSIPIWEGKNRAKIREAQSMNRSAEAGYRDRVLQLKSSLSAARAKGSEAKSRMDRFRERLLPLATQALDNTRSGYEGGQLSVMDLIDSERSLLDLKLTYWRAVADFNQAETLISALIGNGI